MKFLYDTIFLMNRHENTIKNAAIALKYEESKGKTMKNYDALFEDENDILGGTPQSKYWDIVNQTSEDFTKDAFDEIITRMASMEEMLMKYYEEDNLNDAVKCYGYENSNLIESRKKSLYMELAGFLIYKATD